MSCDCMKRIADTMGGQFKYNFPYAEIRKTTFKHKRYWKDTDGKIKPLIALPMVCYMKMGNNDMKIETEVWPTYCPFCGKIRNEILDGEGGKE